MQYRWLKQEIKQNRERVQELRREMEDFGTAGIVQTSSTEWPYVKHSVTLHGEATEFGEMQAEMKILRAQRNRLQAQVRRIERYIANINDAELRRILTLRYLYGPVKMSWEAVTRKMGPGYTAEALKKRDQRHFRKH